MCAIYRHIRRKGMVTQMDENELIPTDTQAPVQHRDYENEIVGIIRSNLSPRAMKDGLLSYHENDVATSLDTLTPEERRKFYNLFDEVYLSEILEYSEHLNEYLSELSLKRRIKVIAELEPTTVQSYLRELPKADRNTIIELMDDDFKNEMLLFSSFDEDEIGSRMTTNYVSVSAKSTVRAAMKELIAKAATNDNISTIYAVDDDGTFVGAIDLKDLIIARESTNLSDVITSSYPYVYTYELIENCIERIKEYSEDSFPVLDSENKLRGVLISQDITELVERQLGEDYAKLAGLSSEEDLREPLKKSIGKRLPWLIVLLMLGLIVSSVVGIFEEVVAHISVIVSFQSLILGMAGNVGTQSLAVTIRVLMDEAIGAKEKLFLVGKEVRVGLVNGLILGALSFIFVGLYLFGIKSEELTFAFSVSACTALALLASVMLSSLLGTTIPIIFKRLKIDPAVASGPLITTANDLVAVISYYGLAWLLLINLLGL